MCAATTPLLCGSACVNQQGDPKNCGTCGHDCLGGTCASGACAPTFLSNAGGSGNGASPHGIAVDSTTVYWTDWLGGTVLSVPKIGGTATTLATASHPIDIAIDSTTLYFTDDSGQAAVPLSGGGVTRLSPNRGFGIALNASSIFFTENALGAVATLPKDADGGAATTLITGEPGPGFIRADSQNIYWSDGDGTTGSVRQARLDGSNPQQLAAGDPSNSPLAVDSSAVYWVEPDLGFVLSVPIGGGTITTIAQQQTTPAGIAIDAQFVYWTLTVTNGAVVRAPKTGGSVPETLASGQNDPLPIAVDATWVYWGNYDGSIFRAPK